MTADEPLVEEPRLAKQPQWVRALVAGLRYEVRQQKRLIGELRLAAGVANGHFRYYMGDGSRDPESVVHIPQRAGVVVNLAGGDVYLNEVNGHLIIMADHGRLAIYPTVTNAVTIGVVK